MKKSLLLIISSLILLSCSQTNVKSNDIMIVSDTHFLGDEITSHTDKYNPINFGLDGRVQEADDAILDAIINTANETKPGVLIISGDLTFNGEKQSHIELSERLKEISNKTQVLVIPGNHDILSCETYSFKDGEMKSCADIDEKEFIQIYHSYGYDQALYKDDNSLSYVYKLNSKQWIFMLDSSMYYQNDFNGFNTVGGYILPDTLSWMENILQKAKEEKISVITCMHHNLALHNERFSYGYRINNYEEVISLLTKYDVKLNLSGHLHIQSINKVDVNDKEIFDIASNSTSIYGNTYGYLKTDNNRYDYQNNFLNVKWETDFSQYSLNKFIKRYTSRIKDQILKLFSEENADKMCEVLSMINAYYFSGRLSLLKEYLQKNESLINLYKESIEDYDNSYMKTILDDGLTKNNISLVIEK